MNRHLILTLFIFSVLLTISCHDNPEFTKNRIKMGDFKATITETGELKSASSKTISMPFIGWKYGWQFTIIQLEEHGAKLNVNDTVVRIDPTSVIKELEEEKNKLETERANLKKLYATHAGKLSQLEAERLSEEANFKLIKLQVDKFDFEPENKQKVKKLELQIAEQKLQNIDKKYEMLLLVNKNDIQIQNVKIGQLERNLVQADIALDKLCITSPIAGIFQLESNRRTKNMVQLGDDIHQGQLIASIPDMSNMKVISSINETDISKLHQDQKVIVRLDAYPEKPFSGKVIYVGKISHEKENDEFVKVFDIEIALEDSDPALKPGMTVSCEIITHELKDVFFIENECIFRDSTQYYLIKGSSGKSVNIPVNLFARNNLYSAIEGEVNKGQRFVSREELEANNEN